MDVQHFLYCVSGFSTPYSMKGTLYMKKLLYSGKQVSITKSEPEPSYLINVNRKSRSIPKDVIRVLSIFSIIYHS